jgi:hypothetical protein
MAEFFPIDHFMFATPDLAETAADIEELTGVRPTPGGQHSGQGTHNMLLSLGTGCYLELVGPDPSQHQTANFGGRLAQLTAPTMLMFGIRTVDIEAAHARASALGLRAFDPNGKPNNGPVIMSRALPAGGVLTWRLLLLAADAYEFGIPFYIQWEGAPHPSENSAAGCRLKKFWVEHPDARALADLYAALSIAVDVVQCWGRPRLNLSINTPKGEVAL